MLMKANKLAIIEERASIGIGAMIVFIAMVLVAGIAASVLVQTSSKLEMQALRTGQETIAEVASGIKVNGVDGHNTSGKIDKMVISISLNAGSPNVDLSQAIVEISDSTNKFVLAYGNDVTNSSSIDGNIYDITAFGSSTTFDIIALHDADSSCTSSKPIMNYGDHVIFAINSTAVFGGLSPRSNVGGLIISEEGAPGILGFDTPPSFSTEIVALQ